MRRFLEIFRMEMRLVVRSWALALLTVASVGWVIALPFFAKGDGTAAGARELDIHYSLGGVFVLLVIALVSAGTGALARERAARRLQLTMVRPVRYAVIALGKIAAYVATGALVLALALAALLVRVGATTPCSHVLSPVLPSPREEAREMYAAYMKSPETPEAVKKAKKEVILRLLTQRAIDHYQTVATNASVMWKFDLSPFAGRETAYALKLRLTNAYDMRQDVCGSFQFAGLTGTVSNITQAALVIPLGRTIARPANHEPQTANHVPLTFTNTGKNAHLLRPRQDVKLLAEGDAFWRNALRAWAECVAALAVVVAFGVFLGAGLGRPVALFVALSTLVVGEMSPSVVSQYPDPLEANVLDRLGLKMARAATVVMRPISALSPIERLAKDECVEGEEVVRTVAADLVAIPLLFVLLSALAMPRKQEGEG